MNPNNLKKSFIWKQRLGFGICDFACNIAYLLVNTYLLFYYTDIASINAASIGFMFVVTKLIDAGTDYMVCRPYTYQTWTMSSVDDCRCSCSSCWNGFTVLRTYRFFTNSKTGICIRYLYFILFWIYISKYSYERIITCFDTRTSGKNQHHDNSYVNGKSWFFSFCILCNSCS